MSENWSSTLASQSYFGHFQGEDWQPHNAWLNIPKINKSSKNLMTSSSMFANYCKKEIAVDSYLLVAGQMPKVQLWTGTLTTFSSWKHQFLKKNPGAYISFLRFIQSGFETYALFIYDRCDSDPKLEWCRYFYDRCDTDPRLENDAGISSVCYLNLHWSFNWIGKVELIS